MEKSELMEVTARLQRLQRAEVNLRDTLPQVEGMPAAEEAVRHALHIVVRRAGAALRRVRELQGVKPMAAADVADECRRTSGGA